VELWTSLKLLDLRFKTVGISSVKKKCYYKICNWLQLQEMFVKCLDLIFEVVSEQRTLNWTVDYTEKKKKKWIYSLAEGYYIFENWI
jgi:Uma2 family endonuclease